MNLYRIGPETYLENYTGLGGSYQDGARWNKAGFPVMYFACSPAVAMLEMGNYLPSPKFVPVNYRLAVYDLPNSIVVDELTLADMPDDWNTFPHNRKTQDVGSQWLAKCENAVLMVPSATVPLGMESIVVINPKHNDTTKLRLTSKIEKIYSERLFSNIK